MHKRMRRDCLIALLACLAGAAQAGDKGLGRIVGFDADRIEVRNGDSYEFVAPATLGTPPIAIRDRDPRNFLLIEAPGGRMVWVSGGDVKTDANEDLRHNCSSLAMSQSPDRGQYGMRGVGERCK